MTTTSRFLITAGTGRSGRRVAHRLVARGLPVRTAARSTGFDWHAPHTWDAALDGCHAAYLCYSPDLALPGADELIDGFSRRAVELGVDRLVLLSGRGEAGAQACERLVLAATDRATVVRCSWFQENFSEHFLTTDVRSGRLALPAGEVTEPFVSLEDVADVAVAALTQDAAPTQDAALTQDSPLAGKDAHRLVGLRDHRVLELTGPRALTFTEAASILSAAAGHPVRYESVSSNQFAAEQVAAGLDPETAHGLAALFAEIFDGRNTAVTGTVEAVLGRPATTFVDYADAAARTGVWS